MLTMSGPGKSPHVESNCSAGSTSPESESEDPENLYCFKGFTVDHMLTRS